MPDERLAAQREQFLSLEKDNQIWRQRDTKRIEDALKPLKDYPLLPYLRLQALSERLKSLPVSEVDSFLTRYAGTPLETTLRKRWLSELANQSLAEPYIEA